MDVALSDALSYVRRSASNQSCSKGGCRAGRQECIESSDGIHTRLLEKFEAERAELLVMICKAFQ